MNRLITFVIFGLLTACGGGGGSGSSTSTPASSGSANSSAGPSIVSCNNTQGSAISARNNTSHRVGQSCLTCHTSGGSATAMTVAGTIYKPGGTSGNPDATVFLYAHNTNTIVATLVTDKCGNFYTTAAVPGLFVQGGPFVDGVDVVVENNDGLRRTMPGLITSGGCNGCHGASNGKIIVN